MNISTPPYLCKSDINLSSIPLFPVIKFLLYQMTITAALKTKGFPAYRRVSHEVPEFLSTTYIHAQINHLISPHKTLPFIVLIIYTKPLYFSKKL